MIWRRIALRLLSGLAVLFAVSVIIFLAVDVLPGDAPPLTCGGSRGTMMRPMSASGCARRHRPAER